MTPRQRWLIIGGLLLATLAAALLIDEPPAPVGGNDAAAPARAAARADPGTRSRTKNADASGQAAAPLVFPEAVADAAAPLDGVIDPFRSTSWVVAPPPTPPAKAVAPPLPFQYLGQLREGERLRVFLSRGGKNLIAATGDVIDGVYTVDEISGGRMTFVYQPLKEKQVLAIGSEK